MTDSSIMYLAGDRRLQDRFDQRADFGSAGGKKLTRTAFTAESMPYFIIATADAAGARTAPPRAACRLRARLSGL